MLNNVNYLNQLALATQAASLSPDGGGQDGADLDDAENTGTEESGAGSALLYANPFENNETPQLNPTTGLLLNTLDGDLSQGIEYLLPNPATRHKLALMRLTAQQHQLQQLHAAILALPQTSLQPLTHRITQKLQLTHRQLQNAQQQLVASQPKLQPGAPWGLNWFSQWLAPKPKAVLLTPMQVRQALWHLAQTDAEKSALYNAITQQA
jgi:hypothetical protein